MLNWMHEHGIDCAVIAGAEHVNHITGYRRYAGAAPCLVLDRDGTDVNPDGSTCPI